MEEIKKYTLLVDREIYEKFKYIAEKAMRSGNKEMELVIEHYIKLIGWIFFILLGTFSLFIMSI